MLLAIYSIGILLIVITSIGKRINYNFFGDNNLMQKSAVARRKNERKKPIILEIPSGSQARFFCLSTEIKIESF